MSSNSNKELDPKTVYVKNIDYGTTEETLKKAFEKFGKVLTCRILKYSFHGHLFSKGKGFIEFEDTDTVEKVFNEQNIEVDGRILLVVQAYKKYEIKNDTAFIAGIPQGTTRNDILDTFKDYNALDARVVYEDAHGLRGGYAFIKFSSTNDRNKAINEMKRFDLKGKKSKLSYARRDFDETN